MTYIRSPFDLLHGAPPGLAVLADGESEIALAHVTAIKRAAFLARIRKRLRIRNPQSKKTGGPKNG